MGLYDYLIDADGVYELLVNYFFKTYVKGFGFDESIKSYSGLKDGFISHLKSELGSRLQQASVSDEELISLKNEIRKIDSSNRRYAVIPFNKLKKEADSFITVDNNRLIINVKGFRNWYFYDFKGIKMPFLKRLWRKLH